jgi:hypothetical protein
VAGDLVYFSTWKSRILYSKEAKVWTLYQANQKAMATSSADLQTALIGKFLAARASSLVDNSAASALSLVPQPEQ